MKSKNKAHTEDDMKIAVSESQVSMEDSNNEPQPSRPQRSCRVSSSKGKMEEMGIFGGA